MVVGHDLVGPQRIMLHAPCPGATWGRQIGEVTCRRDGKEANGRLLGPLPIRSFIYSMPVHRVDIFRCPFRRVWRKCLPLVGSLAWREDRPDSFARYGNQYRGVQSVITNRPLKQMR